MPLPEAWALTVSGACLAWKPEAAPLALAVVDLATAQEWLGATDRLSRVELALPEADPGVPCVVVWSAFSQAFFFPGASPEIRLAPALREAYPGLELRSQRSPRLPSGGSPAPSS